MSDIGFFLDKLISSAKDKNKKDLLTKIQDKSFFESLCEVCSVLKELDYELISKKDTGFEYEKDINLRISRALSNNYFTIYYVNTFTDEYVGYSSNSDYKSLKIEENGHNFFEDVQKNIQEFIYEEDREKISKLLTKEKILEEVNDGKSYLITYRLMLKNIPTYVQLKALKLSNEDSNIIIGISNIDEQKKREMEYQKAIKANITYSNIALALAANYFAIYYVDISSSFYIEYNLDNEYQVLKEIKRGNDFFEGLEKTARENLVPEDLPKFLSTVGKNNLIAELKNNKNVKVSYRQIINSKPEYVELTAMKLSSDNNHIILAVSSIDAWKKKENIFNKMLHQEKQLARTDALTGAFNKYSFKELEKKINRKIKNNSIDEFSVVICDINNLKFINDTLGHTAGDKYINNALKLIKKIFKINTIYRIGGDEFSFILTDNDYYVRDYLYEKFIIENNKNKEANKVTLAIGIADYYKNSDLSLNDVFKRADEKMYEFKKEFKSKL